jgi:hypothetical protein
MPKGSGVSDKKARKNRAFYLVNTRWAKHVLPGTQVSRFLFFASVSRCVTSHATQDGGGPDDYQKYSDWYDNSH